MFALFHAFPMVFYQIYLQSIIISYIITFLSQYIFSHDYYYYSYYFYCSHYLYLVFYTIIYRLEWKNTWEKGECPEWTAKGKTVLQWYAISWVKHDSVLLFKWDFNFGPMLHLLQRNQSEGFYGKLDTRNSEVKHTIFIIAH